MAKIKPNGSHLDRPLKPVAGLDADALLDMTESMPVSLPCSPPFRHEGPSGPVAGAQAIGQVRFAKHEALVQWPAARVL